MVIGELGLRMQTFFPFLLDLGRNIDRLGCMFLVTSRKYDSLARYNSETTYNTFNVLLDNPWMCASVSPKTQEVGPGCHHYLQVLHFYANEFQRVAISRRVDPCL